MRTAANVKAAPAADRDGFKANTPTDPAEITEKDALQQVQIASLDRRFRLGRRLAEIVAPFVYGGRK
jgi:hypothetical protein